VSWFSPAPSKFFDYFCITNVCLIKYLSVVQVTIYPETRSRDQNRAIINELVRLHRQYLDGRLPVYDGRKSIYTAGALPFQNKEFVIKLVNVNRGNQRYMIHFTFLFHDHFIGSCDGITYTSPCVLGRRNTG
jgi:eukaryotic translation initiation factor 2C